MSIQITIIGLGEIGASLGLALSSRQDSIRRVGFDQNSFSADKAQKMGAVDKLAGKITKAVEGADAVILALPFDQIRETLLSIGNHLREDCIVLDTAPVKSVVVEWAAELLPPGRHFIGLTPIINPSYLHRTDRGVDAAREDLFKDGLLAIVSPLEADSGAIKFATDLAELLGATPLYVDAAEVDGLMAATHTLPQLLATALLGITVDQPAWQDGGKFAGRSYAQVTSPVDFQDTPEAVAEEAIANRANIERVLDQLIDYLQEIRQAVGEQDTERLASQHQRLLGEREKWLKMRVKADWASHADEPEAPAERSSFIGQILFGRSPDEKK
jgi:prephenate dehydrogenase